MRLTAALAALGLTALGLTALGLTALGLTAPLAAGGYRADGGDVWGPWFISVL